jgi:uncharacterized membrane protein
MEADPAHSSELKRMIKSTISLAAAAAMIGLAGASVSAPAFAKGAHAAQLVHCYGVNDCKGLSDCKSGNHDCKGLNDCKGQGFKAITAKKCTAAGGSLQPR